MTNTQLDNSNQDPSRVILKDQNCCKDNCNSHYKNCKKRCFSWSAVFVGALVGIGVAFLLNLFAIAIGLTAFVQTTASSQTLALGGFIGLILVAIFSMGTAGWVAGYVGGMKFRYSDVRSNADSYCNHGVLYGFSAWSLALIFTILLSSHIGKFVTVTMATLSNPSVIVQTASYHQPYIVNYSSQAPVASNAATTDTAVVQSSNDSANKLAMTSFVAFVLFFIGALSACVAGHCGYDACCKKNECVVKEVK